MLSMMGITPESLKDLVPTLMESMDQFLTPVYDRFNALLENQQKINTKLDTILEEIEKLK